MSNFFFIISNLEKTNDMGGLFDFNATLFFVIIHFVILTIILNIILYNPILNIIEKRKNYILNNLNKASKILIIADKLKKEYEYLLIHLQKETKIELQKSEIIYKNFFENELKDIQKFLNSIFDKFTQDLLLKKFIAFTNLEKIIETLSKNIENKLSL